MEIAYQDAGRDSGKCADVFDHSSTFCWFANSDCFIGSGVHARQKALIERKATDPDLFNEIETKLEAKFQRLTRDTEEKIRNLNTQHFSAVRVALDTLRNENVVLEAERDPELRERIRVQVGDAQRLLPEINAAVDVAGLGNDVV